MKKEIKFQCPQCNAVYDNGPALGGHKTHCGVDAESSKKKDIKPEPCTCFTGDMHCHQHEADCW